MPTILPRFLTDGNNVTNSHAYKHFPEKIVLDVDTIIEQFIEETADLQKTEINLTDTLEEVIAHISDQGLIDCSLTIMKENLQHQHLVHDCVEDGEVAIKAMTNMAKALSDKLNFYGIYDLKGDLPYKFSHCDRSNSIILQKCLDYV